MNVGKNLQRVYAVAAMAAMAVTMQGWAKLKYDVDAYVQDGLIVHLDGIRNAGATAAHDPAATTWVNLADTGNSAAITANASSGWRQDGYYFAWEGNDYGLPSHAKLAAATPAMTQATFEFVFEGDWASQIAQNWGPHFISGADDQKICMGNAATPLWFKADNWTGADSTARSRITNWSWKQASFTLGAAGASGLAAYDQGVLKDTRARPSAAEGSIPATAWLVGSRLGQIDRWRQLTGVMKSVRIYNKALTAEQVATNAAVDAARFDGVMPVTNALVATSVSGAFGAEYPGVYAVDGSHSFTAPASTMAGGYSYECAGHAVETWANGAWGAPVTNAALSCTVSESEQVRITWLWLGGATITTDGNGNLVIDAPHDLVATNTAAVGNVPKVIKTGVGGGLLTKASSGFAGVVEVREGDLVAAKGTALNGATAYAVSADATLDFGRGGSISGAPSGAGTIRVSGTGVGNVTGNASGFTGTWQLYAANLNFGTAAAPVALNTSSSLDLANNGWFNFFGNQTVAGLSGAGVDGGVDIAEGKTLTVNTANDATFGGSLAGAGSFVKAGAGTLTLSGGGSSVSNVAVNGGSLALKSRQAWTREGLRALWRFDDEDDMGADTSTYGSTQFFAEYGGANSPAVELVDGLVGKAVRVKCTATGVGNYLACVGMGTALPMGDSPYTFSAWLRPLPTSNTGAYIARFCPLGGGGSPGNYAVTGWGYGWCLKFIWENNKRRLTLSYNSWSTTGGADDGRVVGDIPTSNVNDGNWHHVAFTLDASHALKLYWDGQLIGENASVSASKCSVKASTGGVQPVLQLGSYVVNTGYNFDGDFDEVQYLDAVWTAEQVAAEYAAKAALVEEADVLPEPVAHWTFDEQVEENGERLYKDSGPNGWDFKNEPTGSTYVEHVTGDRINGGAAYLRVQNATLQLKDGVDPRTVITSTNPDFTLSVRIRNVLRGDGQTVRPVLGFGNLAGAASCFRLSYEGNPQRAHILPGAVNTDYEGWDLTDTYSTAGADAPWQTFTFVSKASEKMVYCYRDGKLIDVLPSNYTLKLDRIDIGYTPWTKMYGYQVDDLQVFTNLLTAAQVKALVREQAGMASAPLAGVPVTVAAGATLEAKVGLQTVGALTGAGTVDVYSGARFAAADWSCFAGAVTGEGEIFLPLGTKLPLPASQVATGVAFEDNTIVLDPSSSNTPFVRTSGTFSLPTAGTLRLANGLQPGNWLGKRFLLAECADYDGPEDTTGWTFDPAATGGMELLGEFRFSNGRLYLQTSGGGTTIIIR